MNKLSIVVAFLCCGAFGQTPNVRAWGYGASGELGNGVDELTVSQSVPRQVAGLTGVTAIAAGQYHTLALKKDGTVWAWGENANGVLGNGTYTNSNVPVQVNTLTGVTAISGGWLFSLALKDDGTVWAWGLNDFGELGDGTYTGSNVPVQVTGLTGVIAISAGYNHALALKSDGTVWAWGDNSASALGATSQIQSAGIPLQVNGLGEVVAIAAGNSFSLALANDGTVWGWGENNLGQLGNGRYPEGPAPAQVIGFTGVAAIAAGDSYGLALKSDGTVWVWGYDVSFGNSDPLSTYRPMQVSGLAGPTAVATGSYHFLALKSDGTVWAVGADLDGELGDGTYSDLAVVPVQASGLTGVVSVAAHFDHSLALKSDGTVWAWGDNETGELGNGTSPSSNVPLPVSTLAGVVAVAAGQTDSLALKSNGTVWAWGDTIAPGGVDVGPDSAVPVEVNGLTGVTEIASGETHRLALKSDGTVWAWGSNYYGQLGNGTTKSSPVPTLVSGLTDVLAIGAGASHSLALKSDGTVWAWGYNYSCQLGNGTGSVVTTPVQVQGLFGVVAIAGGTAHSVALKSDETVWAWGDNARGELGDMFIGNDPNPYTGGAGTCQPVQATGLTGVVAIAAGGFGSLALKNDGTVWAWGSINGDDVPVAVSGLTEVYVIARGEYHTLALKSDGTAWAWDFNYDGELGNGTNESSIVPTQVSGLTGAVAIAGGDTHSLAVVAGGIPQLALVAVAAGIPGRVGPGITGSQSIPIVNAGAAPLSISNIAIVGINPGDFSLGGTCAGASLMPNQNCSINVTFAPTAQGTRSAAVIITTNAPGSPFVLTVSGTGMPTAPCTYALSSTTLQSPVNGGDLNISIQTGANCAWSVIGLPDWITTTNSGTGPATLMLSVAANSAEPRSALISVASITATVAQPSSQPAVSPGGVVNAASFTAPVAAGSIASVFGSFLLPVPVSASSFPIPTSLGGLSIQFYGLSAPLFYASASQVNAQVPWEFAGFSQVPVSAISGPPRSSPTVNLATYAPGLFAINGAGTGQGAILDSNYNLVSSTNPATAGTVVQIFCTGLGPVTNRPATGVASPSDPLASTPTLPIVMIGGAQATVQFSGLTPGDVGLYQVNATIPAGAAKGTAVPVVLTIGGVQSNTVTIAVQ